MRIQATIASAAGPSMKHVLAIKHFNVDLQNRTE